MIIGNFTYDKARDTYTGELATLTVAARNTVFQPIEAKGDKGPSYRLIGPSKTGDVEFGATWKRSEESRDYLSVKLDDPSLAQPLSFTSSSGPMPCAMHQPDFCGTPGLQASRKSHHTPDPQRGSTTY
jgi:uncharacterized protein (DUF736 family)